MERKKTREKTEDKAAADDAAKDITEYLQAAHERLLKSPAALEYLHETRGLTDETIKKFRLGYEENFREGTGRNSWKAVIIPTTKYTYTARNTDPAAEKKNRVRKHGNNVLMIMPGAFTGERPVFVVEGELDALSIAQAGGVAVALGSTANYRKFTDRVKKTGIKVPVLIVALDDDDQGKEAAKKIEEELKDIEGSASRLLVVPEAYYGYKDANELLIKEPDKLRDLVESADMMAAAEKEAEKREYLKTSVAHHMDDFRKRIQESARATFFPTGFPSLDGILDGGLYAGLYIVGAISSLGKTTFCLQVCDQIAAAGHDVLIFSLEMARDELIAKSISRHTYSVAMSNYGVTAIAKTTRGILTGSRWPSYGQDEMEVLEKSIEEYSGYAGRIFIHEGVGNIGILQIREVVERHIRVTGVRPVVLIDYLQIIAPYDPRATDKQNTDKAVLELKRLSRDDDIPVIGISSFNRENYLNPVSMASFKESGAVEYSSDVLIGLQYAGMDYEEGDKAEKRTQRIRELINNNISLAKSGQPQSIQLKVLKNRNGSKGDAFLEYVAMFNCFSDPMARKGSGPDGEPGPDSEPVKSENRQLSFEDRDEWMSVSKEDLEDLPF